MGVSKISKFLFAEIFVVISTSISKPFETKFKFFKTSILNALRPVSISENILLNKMFINKVIILFAIKFGKPITLVNLAPVSLEPKTTSALISRKGNNKSL